MKSSLGIRLAVAEPADLAAIAALLREAGLPHEDFAPHLAHFIVARDQSGAIVGAAGAEVYGAHALLRSVVVAPPHRGAGLGDALLRRAEMVARECGVDRWWLLTTSAEKFFAARGFVLSRRDDVPVAIQRTGQFSGGCCRTAVCMTRLVEKKNQPAKRNESR
jgi:amino-acid N-acetyltransferase